LGNNPHDEEGEGEEQEDTVYSVKLRAFRLKKAEKGDSGWAELGYGVLRLKKHKETEARRMLLRNSSTGKINIVCVFIIIPATPWLISFARISIFTLA